MPGTSVAQVDAPHLLPQSPLSACPKTPNCVHDAYIFELYPSDLADRVDQALRSLNPHEFQRGVDDSKEMHAVYTVFFFKDDVHVSIQLHDNKSVLFIRSASRTGRSDLGVNRRRVRKILKTLNEQLTGR